MQRYFASIKNNQVFLSQEDSFHLLKVMRGRINDNIEVVDENHKSYLSVIKSINPLIIEVQEPILKNSELDSEVTLFFGLAKSDKNEFVIQKATELGAKKIVLFQAKRSVVKFSKDVFNKKLPRYLSIAKEASEQCHREYIPEIKFASSIKEIKNDLCELNLFAYELSAGKVNELDSLLDKQYRSISVIIGPEGGFDSQEAEFLISEGFKNISLGKRILRCETAAVYALSVIAFKLEK